MALTQISTAGVKDDAVTSGKIPANAVGSSELADNAVDTNAIQDDAVTAAKLASNAVVNASVDASAAIAGTKISPDFGSQNIATTGNLTTHRLTLDSTVPKIIFTDSSHNPDYQVVVNNGQYKIEDTTNSAERFKVNTDGHIDIAGNLDVGAGIDVTGNITCTGTIPAAQLTGTLPAIDGSNLTGVTSTTINSNADNRVITGSGTANTLNGESGLTYDGSNLSVTGGLDVSSDVSIADTIKHTGDTNTKIRFPATDHIGMEVNGSEVVRITPDGALSEPNIRLKASTTVDHAAVQVGGSKNYSAGIPRNQLGVSDGQAYDTDNNGGAIAFHAKYHANGSYTTMGSIEGIKTNNSSGNYDGALVFKTRVHGGANTIRMRLTNDGLCFGTDTAAANALDDYEEGTWTPGGEWDSVVGTYTKIGRVVHAAFQVRVDSTSSNGMALTNLPFACGNSEASRNGIFWGWNEWDSTVYGQLTGNINPGGTNMTLYRMDGSGSNVTYSQLGDNKYLKGVCCYQTA